MPRLPTKLFSNLDSYPKPAIIQKLALQAESGSTSKYGFSPDLGGKNGGVLSMRMQVILDSSFRPSGFSPYMGAGRKGEFRNWTKHGSEAFRVKIVNFLSFFCFLIPKRNLDTKGTTQNIEVYPESLGAMIEY